MAPLLHTRPNRPGRRGAARPRERVRSSVCRVLTCTASDVLRERPAVLLT